MDTILEKLYTTKRPCRVRSPEKPMGVICCGMSRTGTESLSKALTILGYGEVYHGSLLPSRPGDCAAWKDAIRLRERGETMQMEAVIEEILGNCGAVTDFPGAAFAEELMHLYPDAKIVLNIRDFDSWLGSIQGALGFYLRPRQYFEYFDRNAYWMRRYTETNFYPMFDGDFVGNARRVYDDHNAKIRKIVPPERLLEWRVGDGWAPLCEFLDQPVPDVPFPRGNSTAEIKPRLEARARQLETKARRYIGGILITTGGFLAALIALYARKAV